VAGIWKVTDEAREGVLSLLKLWLLLERDDIIPAVSDTACLCIAYESRLLHAWDNVDTGRSGYRTLNE
jgi:hypothetical protein